jgi:hypothetical protein
MFGHRHRGLFRNCSLISKANCCALTEVVSGTHEFREAEAEGKLIRLPTGDGMALVFRTDPEAAAQCALEIARALKEHRGFVADEDSAPTPSV